MTPSHPSQMPIIMRMPVEIIQEIFLWCLPRGRYITGECQLPPAPMEPRLVLTHVCSTWREVAFRMPKMWTDIWINFQHPGFSVHGHSIISAWLSRSSPCPISLQVRRPPQIYDMFADFILSNLHMCRQLYLCTGEFEFQQLVLFPAGTLLEMEDIELYVWPVIRSPPDAILADLFDHGQITAFQRCPKLRRAIFSINTDTKIDFRRLNLPWKQLSVLGFGQIDAILSFDILRECVSLRECTLFILPIGDVAIDELRTLSKRPLLLPSLCELSLKLRNHHELFLTALHIPNLRVFRMMGEWYGFQWPPSFLKLSPRRLDTPDFTLARMTGNDIWEFLHPFQQQTKLSLSLPNSFTSTTWWQELSSGMLIPSVASITFRRNSIGAIIPLLEKRLAASRAAGSGITMFTSVYSGINRPTDPAVVPRLEALEAAGVRVEFNYVHHPMLD
ncbi:hypothetical protein BD779DRAFT_331177 [Infundibulicybe gibba]|nr:hypothetical protein BD779DRAFT_331177 [Infundibulicybe gibba]